MEPQTEIHIGLRTAVKDSERLVHGTRGTVAAKLGYTYDQYNNRLKMNKGSKFFSLEELVDIVDFTQSPCVAEFFAERTGCMVVEKPQPSELDSVDMFDCHLQLNAVKGLLDKAIEDAKSDGVFDAAERKQIKQLKKLYQSTFEAFMQKLNALYSEDV
ncbi:MAG: YmfL family putative regulatory protein [Vibrio sp.]